MRNSIYAEKPQLKNDQLSKFIDICFIMDRSDKARCESGIVFFAWWVTWNYAYSLFNQVFKWEHF